MHCSWQNFVLRRHTCYTCHELAARSAMRRRWRLSVSCFVFVCFVLPGDGWCHRHSSTMVTRHYVLWVQQCPRLCTVVSSTVWMTVRGGGRRCVGFGWAKQQVPSPLGENQFKHVTFLGEGIRAWQAGEARSPKGAREISRNQGSEPPAWRSEKHGVVPRPRTSFELVYVKKKEKEGRGHVAVLIPPRSRDPRGLTQPILILSPHWGLPRQPALCSHI